MKVSPLAQGEPADAMARCTIHLDTRPDGTTTATFVIAGSPPLIVEGPADEVARIVAVQMPSMCAVLEETAAEEAVSA